MENRKSFFGEQGLTSTSANHIANMAKEMVRECHEKLSAVKFYDEYIGLLTSTAEKQISRGMDKDMLAQLPEILNTIVDANSLIAFLREAIKEKERLTKEAQAYSSETALAELSEKMYNLPKPVKEDFPTTEELMSEWTIGEQEKYLSLEAEAAALGKFIHEDGFLNKARVDLVSKLNNPIKVELNGSDTILHTYKASVTTMDVDDVFYSLQKKHREVQAELNGMKKRLNDDLEARKLAILTKYNAERREYDRKMSELEAKKHEIEAQDDEKRAELLKEVQAMKIVIPNRLKAVYDLVNQR